MRSSTELQDLLAFVNDDAKKLRTGLLLCQPFHLGREVQLAAQLNLSPINYIDWKLQHLPDGARFAQISHDSLMQDLWDIGIGRHQHSSVLLFNFDVALTHPDIAPGELLRDALSLLWNLSSGLVIFLQDSAKGLAPEPAMCREMENRHQLARIGSYI